MLPPPHKKHFCGRLRLEDRERSKKNRRVYLLHCLRPTLFCWYRNHWFLMSSEILHADMFDGDITLRFIRNVEITA